MGISRDSRHKRRATGGRRAIHQKKRKAELGRPAANTKLVGDKKQAAVHLVRGFGGNIKYRAIRVESGNFGWASETFTQKARILDTVYNASNNELVRTKTLVKGAIVSIDAAPFRAHFEKKYGMSLAKKAEAVTHTSERAAKAAATRAQTIELESHLKEQFGSGRLLACISSRPGQCGRADGYILEGKELEFYLRKTNKKK